MAGWSCATFDSRMNIKNISREADSDGKVKIKVKAINPVVNVQTQLNIIRVG